jgi:hypothetical protein
MSALTDIGTLIVSTPEVVGVRELRGLEFL